MNKKIALLGGDTRMIAAGARLASKGFSPSMYGINIFEKNFKEDTALSGPVDSGCCSSVGGIDRMGAESFFLMKNFSEISFESSPQKAIEGSECVILPLPTTSDGINLSAPLNGGESLSLKKLSYIMKEFGVKLVCGGKIPRDFKDDCEKSGIEVFDYYEREEFAIANAVPTAEGAIELAMSELPITIHGCRALVIGHGRIGKVLASSLKSLGAAVTVSARKRMDFAWIRAGGLCCVNTNKLSEVLSKEDFDVIFNTVPVVVLGEKELYKVSKNTLIIDLASKPGGINSAVAKNMGLKVIWALSLPGKVAPITAGKIIADTVLGNILTKGEI